MSADILSHPLHSARSKNLTETGGACSGRLAETARWCFMAKTCIMAAFPVLSLSWKCIAMGRPKITCTTHRSVNVEERLMWWSGGCGRALDVEELTVVLTLICEMGARRRHFPGRKQLDEDGGRGLGRCLGGHPHRRSLHDPAQSPRCPPQSPSFPQRTV